MTAAYSGRWRWPAEECDHDPKRRVPGWERRNERGELLHRVPEYCRDCGYTFTPPSSE